MKAMNARMLISCLALAAMFIMAAPAANAQGVAFQASSLPLQARGEGLTETIGAVVLQATAAGTVPAGSSITIVYSGTIANASSFTGQAGLSCSLGGTTCAAAGLSTAASGSQLTVQFSLAVAFAAGQYIEISQVRMNVNSLGSAATTVTATLSGTSSLPASNPITFTQSTVGVSSIVNPSVKGSIPSTGVSGAVQTCSVPVGGTGITGSGGNTFSVKVAELYPAALTSTADETSFSALGTIANGSLVNVAITNVPSGLAISALSYTATQGATVGVAAAFGAPSVNAYTVSIGASTNAFQVSSGSTLNYQFAVTGDSTSAVESFTILFGIGLPKSSNTAFATSAGSLTPIGTVVSATATVSLAPGSGIVSFATNNEGGGTIASIGDCVTNLLFPFTTNQVGFDTNVQISNTSADKLAFPTGGASAQAGTCTMTYYPTDLTTQTSSAAGTAGTPSQFTTPSIPAGGAYSFAQSTSTFKNQSGYMFAVCRFLDAHGFSFVVNGTPTTGTISQGLLALVVPNSSIGACPGAGAQCGRLANYSGSTGGNSAAAGSYEALSH